MIMQAIGDEFDGFVDKEYEREFGIQCFVSCISVFILFANTPFDVSSLQST